MVAWSSQPMIDEDKNSINDGQGDGTYSQLIWQKYKDKCWFNETILTVNER